MTKHIKGKGLWVGAGIAALLAVVVLFSTQAFSAGMTVTAQPLQNAGGDLTYSSNYSGAPAVVTRHESSDLTLNVSNQVTGVTVQGTKASGGANVKVDLLDLSATILDTATVALPVAVGAYSQAVTLPLGTVLYHKVAKVSAVYTATATSVPIAFDAASFASGSLASLTWSHTVGTAGTNRILIVGIGYDPRGASVTGVTYGGQPLTLVGGISATSSRVELWRIVAPLSGPNNVVVSGTGAKEKIAGATSWTGVHQTTPLGTAAFATGTSITPSVGVASATGEVVVDTVMIVDTASLTVGVGQTQRWNGPLGDYKGGGSSALGAAATTMSWTLSGSFTWSIGAVPLKQAQQ